MAPEVHVYHENSRKNGWSLPPHPLQFVAWIVVLYFILIYFTTLVPALISEWQPAAYIINALGCAVHIISHFVAATINPADPAVLKKITDGPTGKFDRKKHPHVIENQYCYLCEVHVGPKSKHCSGCNKCIGGFDHHCKWLNNCVGSRNYRWFLCTLVSGLIGTIMIVCVALVDFIGYFIDKDTGDMLEPYNEIISKSSNISQSAAVFKAIHQPVLDDIWLTIVAITGILALLALILLVHLFSFHVYLMCKGMSTFDYIVKMREREGVRNSEETNYSPPKNSFRSKGNRITPTVTRTKGETDMVDGRVNRERNHLREYSRALEKRERLEENETPPPSTSPIKHFNRNMNRHSEEEERTKIKKLKRRKRKSLPELDDHDIATIGNKGLYKTPVYTESPNHKVHSSHHRTLPIPKTRPTDNNSDTAESLEEINHNKSIDRQSYDSGAYMTGGYSNSPASQYNQSPNNNNVRKSKKKKKKKQNTRQLSDDDSNNELNTTTMFTLNESAKLNRDGSLDYSNGFQSLPLTPIQMRKRPNEIPPLDLSTLRSSTESQNTFKPYSGGLRDSDTYRYLDRERNSNPLLQSVPEGADVEL